jgi:hypothetical protein
VLVLRSTTLGRVSGRLGLRNTRNSEPKTTEEIILHISSLLIIGKFCNISMTEWNFFQWYLCRNARGPFERPCPLSTNNVSNSVLTKSYLWHGLSSFHPSMRFPI